MSFVICLPHTPGTIAMCVVAIFSVACTVLLTSYSSIKMFHDRTLSAKSKLFYYISNISWIAAAAGHAMNACFPLLLPNCWDAIGPFAFIGFWGYAISFTFLYLLFVYKLHIIFKSTPHAISKTLLIHLLIGALIMTITQIMTGYYYGIVRFDKAYIAGTVWLFAHIFYWITILFMFIYKTYRLYLNIFKHPTNAPPINIVNPSNDTQGTYPTDNETTNQKTATLEDVIAQSQSATDPDTRAKHIHIHTQPNIDTLFRPAARCLICLVIALLSTLGADFMTIYRGWIAEIDTAELIQIHVGLNSLDAFINVLCLNLQFSYFDALYKCICFPGFWFFNRLILEYFQTRSGTMSADTVPTNEGTQTDLPPLMLHKDVTEVLTDTLPVAVVS